MPSCDDSAAAQAMKPVSDVDSVTVRFAGDSGDGMQLAGMQLANTSALAGNDVATFPDYPSEIRAPRGTLAGVSGFQVHFASRKIFTSGDQLDALVAMNPAALRENVGDLLPNGVLIVDSDAFETRDLRLAGYENSPLEDASLDGYGLHPVPITSLTRDAVASSGLGRKLAERCRNFFAMGLIYWLYGRSLEPTLRFIETHFGHNAAVAEADRLALKAGWSYGETTDAMPRSYRVAGAKLAPGRYRTITGNQALAWGLVTAAKLSEKELFLGTYPITPASDILHELSRHKNFGVRTFQAEDEIAAMASVIGAAFGGAMAVTTTSGPGMDLKTEAMGLAVMLELPMLIVSVQRGGPSTGLPTKAEQADLFQALFGRHGEAPLPVLAASGAADCFNVVQEAWRLAVRLMSPVVLLSDAYIANSAEPWRIPDVDELEAVKILHPGPQRGDKPYSPYARDELLARPWALPGTPGLIHRIGGLEKQDGTGNVSYAPDNHQSMVRLRARKVDNAVNIIPPQEVTGPDSGPLLILSWGGTRGSCADAIARARELGKPVAHAHLRHLNPLPANLGTVLERYERVLIPELNTGQLRHLVRARFLIDAIGLNKVRGRPLASHDILSKIDELLD